MATYCCTGEFTYKDIADRSEHTFELHGGINDCGQAKVTIDVWPEAGGATVQVEMTIEQAKAYAEAFQKAIEFAEREGKQDESK